MLKFELECMIFYPFCVTFILKIISIARILNKWMNCKEKIVKRS